ncbi:MAG TPA: redoxin domain-containing protein [Planctomycetes bacterium]|nr:redoxin domain-containing protein [Planctomycetota bacterium]
MAGFLTPPPPRRLALFLGLLLLTGLGVSWYHRENPFAVGGVLEEPRPFPPFPTWESGWIGSDPLTTADLEGRVTIVELWTFECINCIRSMPFVHDLHGELGDRVRWISVHSPEFASERDPVALRAAIERYRIQDPVFVDSTLELFTALDPPGWPTFYVVDASARIRGMWSGEIRPGSRRGKEFEEFVRAMLRDVEG